MKTISIILLSFVIFGPTYAKADTQTTGNLKLLQPTTGQAFSPTDATKRPWGDKINVNFQIIDSSFSTSQTNLTALNSTVTAISASTSTLFTLLNSTAVQLSSHITSANSTMTVISNSTSTLGSTLAQRTVVVSDEGSALVGGNVTRLDCVGTGVACTQSGSTVTLTASGGGAAASGNSTNTVTLAGGGAVYLSTTTPALGTIYSVGKSTWHVIDLVGFTAYVSTVARTAFQVGVTTSNDYGTPWQLRSPQIHVTTTTKYSTWITTGFNLNYGDSFGVFIQTVAPSGLQAAEWGVTLRYWKEPEPYP